MSVESYRSDVARHQKEIARLQSDKARESAKVAAERKKAFDANTAAGKTKSLSTIQSKLRDAQRYESAAVSYERKVADIEAKIAKEQARLNDASRRLRDAERQLEHRRTQERQRLESAGNLELARIRGRLSEHDHLHHLAFSTIEKLSILPSQITVLFFAANPLDQQQLRLDEEVRLIGEMIRKSEYRDSVKLESRWAVRPYDLLQAINECNPRIIHFSGHGSDQEEIVFQDAAGNAKLVSKDAIVQTIMAGSDEVQLVFFNTCYSRSQAEAVVAHVPAAIGMKTSIGDKAARNFAAQFYSSIGFGHSVGKAFSQAKAALMLEGIPEESTPELFLTDGLDMNSLVFVKS